MNAVVISITHPLQLLESETDTDELRASKVRLREILQERFAAGPIAAIFEESSLTMESIAGQLARQRDPRVP